MFPTSATTPSWLPTMTPTEGSFDYGSANAGREISRTKWTRFITLVRRSDCQLPPRIRAMSRSWPFLRDDPLHVLRRGLGGRAIHGGVSAVRGRRTRAFVSAVRRSLRQDLEARRDGFAGLRRRALDRTVRKRNTRSMMSTTTCLTALAAVGWIGPMTAAGYPGEMRRSRDVLARALGHGIHRSQNSQPRTTRTARMKIRKPEN